MAKRTDIKSVKLDEDVLAKAGIKHFRFFDAIAELPFVEAIYLFGSRARGDASEKSDIDLAIVCPSADIKEWLDIKEMLDNAPVLNHIDAVRYDKLDNGLFKRKIDEDKQVLYAKN